MIKDFFRKYWWRYAIGITLLISVDLIQIFIPNLVGNIVDELKKTNPQTTIIQTFIVWIIVLAGGLALGRFLWRVAIIGAARLFEKGLMSRMFNHIISLDQDFFDKWRTGDLMTRFTSDASQSMRMFGFGVIMLVDTIFMTLSTIVAMGVLVNWPLALKCLIPVPFIAGISLFFGTLIEKRFKKMQECSSDLSNVAEESISGVQVIKVFSNQETMWNIFNNKSKASFDASMDLVKTWGLMFPLIMFFGALSSLFVFYFGGQMVVTGEITLGEFIKLNSFIGMLVWPMMAFGWLVNMIQSGRASLKRIKEVLDQKNTVIEPELKDMKFKDDFEIKNLTFKYPNSEREVLKDVSLRIKPGEMIALVGKVGCGKSTLTKLLVKMYPVETGMIYAGGKDINDIHGKIIRDNVSYVPQDTFLFSMSIRENIAFSDAEHQDKAEIYSKMANVHNDIEGFPLKYNTVVGERGMTLSGGQKQRVTIARALAKNSKVVILDDCLSAVDVETEELIIKSLRQEIKDKTVIVISHRLKAVKNADRIFVLDDGRVVEEGTHDQLLEIQGIYNSMYQKQLIEQRLEEE